MSQHLEVWGDPIDHTKSPVLHAAAYEHLGLDWTFGRRRVSRATFEQELAKARGSLLGVSATMPLKNLAFDLAVSRDSRSTRAGVANTLLFHADGMHAFNTDIGGFRGALADNGVHLVDTARVIGAGATAGSALVALAEAGAKVVEVVARSPLKARNLLRFEGELGIEILLRDLADTSALTSVDATIATLPGGTEVDKAVASALASTGGPLVDAVYAPWPSSLAMTWQAAGLPASSGLAMLLHQAVLQVRIFVTGDILEVMPQEDVMLAKMRSALMGD